MTAMRESDPAFYATLSPTMMEIMDRCKSLVGRPFCGESVTLSPEQATVLYAEVMWCHQELKKLGHRDFVSFENTAARQ